ncbi:hypothetical protein [Microbispora triticiradicis]|uniref:hypothetical protein n=1 Tax=Microbispora triticiradicis TaxID=2200763 RepID=UPI0014046883|nr:hypothetical protein [Microbispora triticiradicis]
MLAVILLLGVMLFLFVSLDPGCQVLEVGRGELPSEGPSGLVVTPLAALPRWEEPLSTTQNTRLAEV